MKETTYVCPQGHRVTVASRRREPAIPCPYVIGAVMQCGAWALPEEARPVNPPRENTTPHKEEDMTIIRVSSGYEPPENAYTGDGGTYVVTLVNITEPRHVPAGKYEARDVQEWQFAIDDGQDHAGEVVFDSWVTAPKDGNVHPKSTYYGYMTALFGKQPPEGADIDVERHLVGRGALATVERTSEGYVNIINLGALPAGMVQQRAGATQTAAAPANGSVPPQPQPAPPAAAPAPLREQVAASDDGLPF